MNIKKGLSQFLLATMLLSFSTPTYPAGFWSGLFTSASDAIKKNPIPVLFATAATLVAGAFYCGSLWAKKRSAQKTRTRPTRRDSCSSSVSSEENEPCIGTEKTIDALKITVKQAKVLDQNETDDSGVIGGGGASCGYQTFKNSLLAVYKILGREFSLSTSTQLSEQLNSPEIAEALLGSPVHGRSLGRWREVVLAHRPLGDNGEWLDDGEIEKLIQEERIALDGLLKDTPFNSTVIPSLTFVAKDPDELVAEFNLDEANRKKAEEKMNSLAEQIQYAECLTNSEVATLTTYLDELKEITDEDGIDAWLTAKGIDNYDLKRRFRATIRNCSPLDQEQIRNRIIGIQNPIKEQIEAARREFAENDTYTHVFMLGTMNYSLEQMHGSAGHWFAVVVNQKDGHREYSIYDSLNHIRLNDERVIALIQMLEDCSKEKIQSELQLTQEELDQMAGQILSLLDVAELEDDQREELLDLNNQYAKSGGTHNFEKAITAKLFSVNNE